MKTAVFWDDAPCSLVEVYRRFRGQFLEDYATQHPGRQHFSTAYMGLSGRRPMEMETKRRRVRGMEEE
jgi:hypothetical protein